MNKTNHPCGGTILTGGSGEQAHHYCDRCGAFAYDSYLDEGNAFPDGTNKTANQEAYDAGEECSPKALAACYRVVVFGMHNEPTVLAENVTKDEGKRLVWTYMAEHMPMCRTGRVGTERNAPFHEQIDLVGKDLALDGRYDNRQFFLGYRDEYGATGEVWRAHDMAKIMGEEFAKVWNAPSSDKRQAMRDAERLKALALDVENALIALQHLIADAEDVGVDGRKVKTGSSYNHLDTEQSLKGIVKRLKEDIAKASS
jgi:hypothetical protein